MTRKRNEMYDVAEEITRLMNPDPRKVNTVMKMNLVHVSKLCNSKKSDGAGTYPPKLVLSCWKQFKKEMDEIGYGSSIMGLLNGNPTRIDVYIENLMSNAPPIYECDEHNQWVMKNAEALACIGYRYPLDLVGDGRRIPVEVLSRYGLIEVKDMEPTETEQINMFVEIE